MSSCHTGSSTVNRQRTRHADVKTSSTVWIGGLPTAWADSSKLAALLAPHCRPFEVVSVTPRVKEDEHKSWALATFSAPEAVPMVLAASLRLEDSPHVNVSVKRAHVKDELEHVGSGQGGKLQEIWTKESKASQVVTQTLELPRPGIY